MQLGYFQQGNIENPKKLKKIDNIYIFRMTRRASIKFSRKMIW